MEAAEEKVAKLVAPRNTFAVREGVPTPTVAAAVSFVASSAIVPAAVIPVVAAPMPTLAIVALIAVPMMWVAVTRIVGIARVPIRRIRVSCPWVAVAITVEVLRAGRVLHGPQAKRGGSKDCAREYCVPAPASLRVGVHS